MTTDTSAKALFPSDVDPKRIHDVADGLRRQGEFEAARMLDNYAAEKRRARDGVTDENVQRFLDAWPIDPHGMFLRVSPQRVWKALEAVWPDGRDAKSKCDHVWRALPAPAHSDVCSVCHETRRRTPIMTDYTERDVRDMAQAMAMSGFSEHRSRNDKVSEMLTQLADMLAEREKAEPVYQHRLKHGSAIRWFDCSRETYEKMEHNEHDRVYFDRRILYTHIAAQESRNDK